LKRSEALKPLSHEHHHALFVTKVIKDSETKEAASKAFTDFWIKEGATHFRIEEEVLLPGSGLSGPSSDEGVARLLDDHLDIRRRAAKVLVNEASLDEIRELGLILHSHVRFEERDLFPRIEACLDDEALKSLAQQIEEADPDHR